MSCRNRPTLSAPAGAGAPSARGLRRRVVFASLTVVSISASFMLPLLFFVVPNRTQRTTRIFPQNDDAWLRRAWNPAVNSTHRVRHLLQSTKPQVYSRARGTGTCGGLPNRPHVAGAAGQADRGDSHPELLARGRAACGRW